MESYKPFPNQRLNKLALPQKKEKMQKHVLKIVKTKQLPIFRLLEIEESIMRANKNAHESFFFISQGNPERTIVMGAGDGRTPHKLLHTDKCIEDSIPVIKRFSGGGTVIVDKSTIFVGIAASSQLLHDGHFSHHKDKEDSLKYDGFKPYPLDIMRWTELLYKKCFAQFPAKNLSQHFSVRENDYVWNKEKKFGGSAQYVTGGKVSRFTHHTSFLWQFDDKNMSYLKLPERRPEYRQSRDHSHFLCKLQDTLKEFDPSVAQDTTGEVFVKMVEKGIHSLANEEWSDQILKVESATLEEAAQFLPLNTYYNSEYLNLNNST